MKRLNELFDIDNDMKIYSIHSDSRYVKPYSIFFCIEGLSVDGHRYVDDAIFQGAKVIVHSKDIEKQLLDMYDLKADIIKVGHHGSNTSSDEEFLNQLDCRLAIISAGYKNKYNHPSTETLKNLQSLNINTLCTNTSGSIAIYTLHHFGFVVTNDGMFGIIAI